jgi:hypothetical protein
MIATDEKGNEVIVYMWDFTVEEKAKFSTTDTWGSSGGLDETHGYMQLYEYDPTSSKTFNGTWCGDAPFSFITFDHILFGHHRSFARVIYVRSVAPSPLAWGFVAIYDGSVVVCVSVKKQAMTRFEEIFDPKTNTAQVLADGRRRDFPALCW